MLWQICFILVLVRQLLIIQAYLLKIFICVIIIISFVPNKLSGMTNQLLILFSKYGCFRFVLFCFLLSLCGLSRTTEWLAESWLLRRDIGIIWEEGVGMFFFSGREGIWNPHGGFQWHKGPCAWFCFTRKTQPTPQQL